MKLNFLFLAATSLLLSSSFCLTLVVNGLRLSKKRVNDELKRGLMSDQNSTSQFGKEKKLQLIDVLLSGRKVNLKSESGVLQLQNDLYSFWRGDYPAFTLQTHSGKLLKKVFVRDVISVEREFLKDSTQFKYTLKTASGDDFHVITPANHLDWLDAFQKIIAMSDNELVEKHPSYLYAPKEVIRKEKELLTIPNSRIGDVNYNPIHSQR